MIPRLKASRLKLRKAPVGRPDDDPHWATLWQGSVALAEEILSNPELVAGKRVVDLGEGRGGGVVSHHFHSRVTHIHSHIIHIQRVAWGCP